MIDALVTGQSLPALQTALDLAEVGLRVVVVGATESEEATWYDYDVEGSLASFASRVAAPFSSDEAESQASDSPAAHLDAVDPPEVLLEKEGRWLSEATPSALGIPAVPLAKESIALLGKGGAFRAYLDRVTPLLTVGKTKVLGDLIKKRMGAKVCAVLVEPQVRARFGVAPDELDVAVALPGFNETLSRAGTLSSAVLAYSDRNVTRETRVTPHMGAEAFRAELWRKLEAYGVTLMDESVAEMSEVESGWSVELSDESHLVARSIVADFGYEPLLPVGFSDVLRPLQANQARAKISIEAARPVWLTDQTEALSQAGCWSLTVRPKAADRERCLITLGSPKGDAEGLRDIVLAAKHEHKLPEAVRLPEWVSNAEVIDAQLRAARFSAVSQRAEAEASLVTVLEYDHHMLPVGRSLHGDDQSLALHAAHRSAVHLRRKLLGLEE